MKNLIRLLILAVWLTGGAVAQNSKPTTVPTIRVKPDTAMIDEVVSIFVSGLAPKQTATIKAMMTDNHGAVWQSSAEFIADRKGVVDLGKQAPTQGGYTDVDPMGLLWAMKIISEPQGGHAAANRFLAPVVMKFDLEIGGQAVSSANLTRLYVAPDVKSQEVRDGGLVAKLYQPGKGGPHPGILVLGGSEGGIRSAEANAALLASHGYAALAVAYFGMEGLPQRLAGVPLDYLKKAIDWMATREGIDRRRLAIFGGSKGGELALLLAANFPELKAVVAYVPSHVVWQGIGAAGASWSYEGRPLPFVPYKSMPSSRGATQPISYMPFYLASLDNQEAVTKALIPVEKINGPVLLISGKDDQLWPSSLMAEKVIARLNEHRHPFKFEHLAYESAGHSIDTSYGPKTYSTGTRTLNLGGQPASNARAQADSWPKVLKFLADSFKNVREK